MEIIEKKGGHMNLHDYLNVRRVFRSMAAQRGCPVWMVKRIIQHSIDESWEKAKTDPEAKARWDKYFPKGKPSADQYILRLGHAHETGENIPLLF